MFDLEFCGNVVLSVKLLRFLVCFICKLVVDKKSEYFGWGDIKCFERLYMKVVGILREFCVVEGEVKSERGEE